MIRPPLGVLLLMLTPAALVAQQPAQPGNSEGVSHPPSDAGITVDADAQAAPKPPAAHPANTPPPAAAAPAAASAPAPAAPAPAPGVDDGVLAAPVPPPGAPAKISAPTRDLMKRGPGSDPDGDVVHPAPLPRGEIGAGTLIRVRLRNELSSNFSEVGQPFESRVATDVLQDGKIVIPAGSMVTGKVAGVSRGHLGGHGTLLLRPDAVTLPGGQRFLLRASVSATPGSHTRVDPEGGIAPSSRVKVDAIEYGGGVGAGLIAGAALGGPAGALAGGLVGATVVTVHLLESHPQAKLEPGAVLMLTLTEQIHLVADDGHAE